MKNLYDEMPNGYQESIQKGLSAVRYFSRNMSFGTVSREECKLRYKPDGFAKQNGRGAERADTLTL